MLFIGPALLRTLLNVIHEAAAARIGDGSSIKNVRLATPNRRGPSLRPDDLAARKKTRRAET